MSAGILCGDFQDKSLIFLWFQVSDDNNDADEFFSLNGCRAKVFKPYFQSGPLLLVPTTANLQHPTIGI